MELRDPLDFETKIFAKDWNRERFRDELRRIPHRDWIAVGTATDPYQPAERRHQITRRMLEVLAADRGRRLSITTKSDLVVRDLNLLTRIASANVLHVAITITTMDEALARKLEPYAPRPGLRMESVRRLSAAGLSVGVLVCPVLPLLNDSEDSIEAVAREASRAGASSLAGGVVFLKPCTHDVLFPFLERHYPNLAPKYRGRFACSAFLRGSYPDMVRSRILRARQRHGLRERFPDYLPEHWPEEAQMDLPFPERGRSFVKKSTC
jgi:DNA repair photolyase